MPDKKGSKKSARPEFSPAPIARYEAKVGLDNGATGRRYEPGDIVTTDDFSAETLEHWVETGRVVAL